MEMAGSTKEIAVALTNLLGVGLQPLQVATMATGHHEAVRHATCDKTEFVEVGTLERMVNQLVVAGRVITAEATLADRDWCHRGGAAPLLATGKRWRVNVQHTRSVGTGNILQQTGGGIDEATRGVELATANRAIPGVDAITDAQGQIRVGAQRPRGFVNLAGGNNLSILFGRELNHVAGKFPHQIAAWNP